MQWTTKKIKIKDLKENAHNPRRMTKDQASQLKSSIQKFGLCEPIVANIDGSVIGGHQRLKTLIKLGEKEVDVYMPEIELSEAESNELNIRLNKNTGEWDFDVLANEWDVNDLVNWGFDPKELEIETIDEKPEEEGEILSPPADPKTILGNVYTLGEHRLMCGDSTDPDQVTKLLNGNTPILMVTDPPYGVNYDAKWRSKAGKGSRACGSVLNDDKINWSLAWNLFPGSVAYVWHAGKFSSEVQKNLEEAEFEVVSQIIWNKQHFALSRGDYHWKHEPCWYAVKKGCGHNWQGSRKECTVWDIANLNAFGGEKKEEDERTEHSTQKPFDCMAKPIKNNSAEGEGVYDPFCGSGTTLIAAEHLNRKSFCMELSPVYCDIIVSRWVKNRKKAGKDHTVTCDGKKIIWET